MREVYLESSLQCIFLCISAPLLKTSSLIFILGFSVGEGVAEGGASHRKVRSFEALILSAHVW